MSLRGDLKFIAVLFLLFFGVFAVSQSRVDRNPYPDLSLEVDEVAERFAARWPNTPVETVEASPVAGVYTVVTGGSHRNVLYFSPQSGHLFFGHLYSASGDDLTAPILLHWEHGDIDISGKFYE